MDSFGALLPRLADIALDPPATSSALDSLHLPCVSTAPINLLPDELLCEIFSYPVSGPEDYTAGSTIKMNFLRARSTFNISAVCRRWRDAACDCALLWHYIVIRNRMHNAATLAYLDWIFARSRDVSIDIVFQFVLAQEDFEYDAVLASLVTQRPRWRRLIAIVEPGLEAKFLNLFCGPTPRLRTFQISVQQNADADPFCISDAISESTNQGLMPTDAFLPHAPNLYCATLVNIPQVTLRESELLQTLSRQRNLEWLLLGCASFIVDDDSSESFTGPIELPHLDCLWVQHEADMLLSQHPTTLRMPVLNELTLQNSLFSSLHKFFIHVNATSSLRELYVRSVGAFSLAEVETLALLERLELVHFWWCPLPGAMLRRLADRGEEGDQSIMWPQLTHIEFWASKVDEEGVDEAMMVNFAKARSEAGPVADGRKPKWRQCLVEVSGSGHNIPDDQMQELNMSLWIETEFVSCKIECRAVTPSAVVTTEIIEAQYLGSSSGRRRGSASITIADIAQPVQVSVHEPNPEAEHERHAHLASVPALFFRRAAPVPEDGLAETASVLPRHPSLRTRLRQRSPRRGRPTVDRQSTFLTELSSDEMDSPEADSEFENPEDVMREQMFARVAELLRERVAPSVEAQRMQRVEMRKLAVGPFDAY
ncbi:hypothetical protein BKA62DRAFT_834689 [Auriculariales sp. MPI-PUGE-AT-0066]|nr:hypothetical protein BKA62DRAFT_834689 [Auriculariales sp. MPI-PUGE-AT-0066]